MKTKLNLLALLIISSAMTGTSCLADTISGTVTHVASGDSLTLHDGEKEYKIRLLGIDAPELPQAFGNQARDFLAEMVKDNAVLVVYKTRNKSRPISGKIIFQGQDINLKQIQNGMAWYYSYQARELEKEDRAIYAHAEELARKYKLGLWEDKWPLAPWAWRKKNMK